MAKTTQLIMEYDPQPLFDAGIPDTVDESIVQSIQETRQSFNRGFLVWNRKTKFEWLK